MIWGSPIKLGKWREYLIIFILALAVPVWAQSSFENAHNLQPIDKVVGWVDYDSGNSRDVWKVDVPGEGALLVTLTGTDWEAEIDLAFFDSQGEVLDFSREEGSQLEYVRTSVPKGGGTYYVQVRARGPGDAGGYILSSFAAPDCSVLVFQHEDLPFPEEVLRFLGIKEYKIVNKLTDFLTALESKSWDLVIVYYAEVNSDSYVNEIATYLHKGGALIVCDDDLKDDKKLLKAMGATWLGPTEILEIHEISNTFTTSMLTIPNYLSSIDGMLVDVVQAMGSAQTAATWEGKWGMDTIVISHEGRAVLNSFDVLEEEDEAGLLMNEIVYTLTASQWQKFKEADWWYNWWYGDPVDDALDYLREAKFASAMKRIDTALSRLVALAPHERMAWYVPEDLLPGPKDDIEDYRQKIEATDHLYLRIADLVEVISVFFNRARPTDSFKEFAKEASRRMESAAVWINDLEAELDRAEESGLGIYPFPPCPVFTSLYQTYSAEVEPLSLCSLEAVNYSGQTRSVTITASVPSLTTRETLKVVLSPKSKRLVSLNPGLLSEAQSLTAVRAGRLQLKIEGREYGPYPVEFLPKDESPIVPIFYPYLIEWITPKDPAIRDFARKALEAHPGGGKEARARALWEALKKHGFRYLGPLPANTAWSQRIRPPAEALAEHGGNCLESTLLMASLLEAAGVEPLVSLIPSEQHAMVGWCTSTGELLFSVQDGQLTQIVQAIDAGTIPDDLRNAFRAKEHRLSDQASVEVVTAGAEWRIINQERVFIIRLENGTLNIYTGELKFLETTLLNSFPFDTALTIGTDYWREESCKREVIWIENLSPLPVWKYDPEAIYVLDVKCMRRGGR